MLESSGNANLKPTGSYSPRHQKLTDVSLSYQCYLSHNLTKCDDIFEKASESFLVSHMNRSQSKDKTLLRCQELYMNVLCRPSTRSLLLRGQYFFKIGHLHHVFQLSCFEREAPVLRGELPSSRSFLKTPVLR